MKNNRWFHRDASLLVMLNLAGVVFAGEPPIAENSASGDGTRRMTERLEQIAKQADPRTHPWLNAERAALLKGEVKAAPELQEAFTLRSELAQQLMLAGDLTGAITELNGLRRFLEEPNIESPPGALRNVRQALALCYFRGSRIQSAKTPPASDAYLIPIPGPSATTDPQVVMTALNELTGVLREHPDSLADRWLLNLTYMALGSYPDKVPPEWLIPPKAFESEYKLPRFRNAAPDVGLDARSRAGGVIMEDFDGDGFLDILCSSCGLRDPIRYFRSNGDGSFSDRTREAGLVGEVAGMNLSHGDYNNDGFVDVLVLRGGWMGELGLYPNSLLRNNGEGTFTDVTEVAGLLSFHPTQVGVWADYNNDGWLDIFVGNESSAQNVHPCELFHNNGNGTFSERAVAVGLTLTGYIKGAAWGDYDNDGLPDLFLSRFGEPNVLYHNDGPQAEGQWKFSDVTERTEVYGPLASTAAWFWDYDNDGWLDIFVASAGAPGSDGLADVAAEALGQSSRGQRPRLYRNNRNGGFTDVTAEVGLNRVILGMGANFGDLDNDGFLDCYIGTGQPDMRTLIPHRMFRNDAGRSFQDVTTAGGFGLMHMGNGIAFGDVDNDGDQDIYLVNGGVLHGDVANNVLFENPGSDNHWITLQLEGKQTNRRAVGARIKVVTENDDGNKRDIYAVVSTGGSFGSSSLQQEIGLGRAKSIDSVEITWPVSGERQVFRNLPMDRFLRFQEGEADFKAIEAKRIKLREAKAEVKSPGPTNP